MAGDLNDVVRHVILRIVVDQAGLAEDLAAARAKLKALKDSEKEINKERSKNADTVTEAIDRQNKALGANQQAHEAAQRAAVNGGRAQADSVKERTAAIKDDTKATEQRTVAEARAAAIDKKARQDELDAQQKRSAAKKKAADEDEARQSRSATFDKKARQDELDAIRARAAARQRDADDQEARRIKNAAAETKGRQEELNAQRLRSTAKKKDADEEEARRIRNTAAQTKARQDELDAQTRRAAVRTKAAAEEETRQVRIRAAETKARRDELDSQRARSAARIKDVADEDARRVKIAGAEEKARQDRLRAEAERRRYNQESAAKEVNNETILDALKRRLDSEQKDREKAATDRRSADRKKAQSELEILAAKTDQLAEKTRNLKLGGQTDRTIARVESEATIARKDTKTTADVARSNENAEAARLRSDANAATQRAINENKATADIERRKLESDQRVAQREETQEQKISAQRLKNQETLSTQILKDIEAVSQAQSKTSDQRNRAADAAARRDETRPDFIASTNQRNRDAVEISGAKVDQAQSTAQKEAARAVTAEKQAQIAAARTLNEQDRTNTEISTRRERTELAIQRAKEDIAKVAAQTNLIEERAVSLAERRARTTTPRWRKDQVVMPALAAVGNVASAIGTAAFDGPDNTSYGKARSAMRDVGQETNSARAALREFWRVMRSGEGEAASVLEHLRTRFRNLKNELKPASSGGGNLINNFFGNVNQVADGFLNNLSKMSRHLISFQSLIVAAVVALGPLAAILGAIGAAALGLASNLVSLVGVFAALPGLIGAAVSGFGALLAVIKPISSVFSAYTAAQKEANKSTSAATKATNDLTDARKKAKRSLEDYRDALAKLQFDEEGAQLDVEQAELDYRKTLADPTATDLDRRQALHNIEQARYAQKDQAKTATRTREDAAAAEAKGVEGSDEVTSVTASQNSAQDEFKRQMAAFPPLTRKVLEAIFSLSDAYKKMRNTWSENIFGPISKDTGKFKDVLKELDDFLDPASVAVGNFAKQALDLFTNADWKKFFSEQGDESAYIIKQLGDAALATADGFRGLTEAARPFTRWVVDGIKSLANSFKDFSTSEEGRKKISDFLDLTSKRMSELWAVVKNLAAGFAGFFAALNTSGGGQEDFTTYLNKGLLSASETFRQLGDQARDPNSGFQKWLRDVRPLLHDIVHFLSQAASFFGDLFSNRSNITEARDILKAIADKWLPKLAEIFDDLSKSGAVSKVANAVGSVLSAFENFLNHGGVTGLSLIAGFIQEAGSAVDYLTSNFPGLISVLGTLGALLGAVFGAVLFAKFTGILDSIKLIKLAIGGLIALAKGAKLSDLLSGGGGNNSGSGGSTTPTKPTKPTPSGGTTTTTTPGTAVSEAEDRTELTVLKRMEIYLRQIAINTGGVGTADVDIDKEEKTSKTTKTGTTAVEDDIKSGTKTGGKTSWIRRLLGLGAEEVVEGGAAVAGTAAAASAANGSGGGSIISKIKKFFGGGGASTAASEASTATSAVAEGAAVASKGSKLLKFAKGGPAAIAASVLASVAGGAVIDNTVKNNDDKNSVNRGLNSVVNGAAIGGTIGSVVPVIGTAAGAAAGGVIGGAYSLATDKNLRNFVGDKYKDSFGTAKSVVGSAASSVGGFFKDAGSSIKDLFTDTDLGKSILDSLKSAGTGIKNFFTKDIPQFFSSGVKGIENFFTHTLPGLPKKAAAGFILGLGYLFGFLTERLPRLIATFFTKTLPDLGRKGAKLVTDGFKAIGEFFTVTLPQAAQAAWDNITNFFTKTLPQAAGAAWEGITNFFTVTLPGAASAVWDSITTFFTKTLPGAAQSAWDGITNFFTVTLPGAVSSIFETIKNFFTTDLPNFFTETLPDAIKKLPGLLYDNLVQPVIDFFKGLKDHIHITDLFSGASDLWNWAKSLFEKGEKAGAGKMSGGLIEGVYQGIQDTAHIRATPGEFMFRKSVVDEPGAKAIMSDWNEGRITVADLTRGLAASTSPRVMSVVPPSAQALTGAIPTIVNHTVNHAPLMGDVTIHNPVREKSDHSLRRQVQIAANRHRR